MSEHEVLKLRNSQPNLINNKNRKNVVAGDRTRVTRVIGRNTHHYTTMTSMFNRGFIYPSYLFQLRWTLIFIFILFFMKNMIIFLLNILQLFDSGATQVNGNKKQKEVLKSIHIS